MEAFCSLSPLFFCSLCAHQGSLLPNCTVPCMALCQHSSLCSLLLTALWQCVNGDAEEFSKTQWCQTPQWTDILKKQRKNLHLVFLHKKPFAVTHLACSSYQINIKSWDEMKHFYFWLDLHWTPLTHKKLSFTRFTSVCACDSSKNIYKNNIRGIKKGLEHFWT